VNTRKTILG